MSYFLGIDLGSTTTKAVLIDEQEMIIGRGLTNTRCNYSVATEIAKAEALHSARFTLLKRELERVLGAGVTEQVLADLDGAFRVEQQMTQLLRLAQIAEKISSKELVPVVREIFKEMESVCREAFQNARADQSRFFRDLAGSCYYTLAEHVAASSSVSFDTLAGIFDKAILLVENEVTDLAFGDVVERAFRAIIDGPDRELFQSAKLRESFLQAIRQVSADNLTPSEMVGTGYGRQRLPFEKHQIRSEILCHGLGAHFMYPDTRTVLDIGGQDTKAIQVDGNGVVTSFQMNDRCAAGCGRYLGYIADELNLGLHELGPLSLKADHTCQICSTCTVFAGAELRDLLSLGEKRENILAGLHKAIILRAMSLLARSGGVENEFTFTGGVAKNQAVVEALSELVVENYGERTLNINADSIYTGALGAALYANRAIDLEGNLEERQVA